MERFRFRQQLKNTVNFAVSGVTIIGQRPSPKLNDSVFTDKERVTFLLPRPFFQRWLARASSTPTNSEG